MRIRQYIPAYIDVDEDNLEPIVEVANDADPFTVPWIERNWAHRPGFHRFSQSGGEHGGPTYLMAEMYNGDFWVVAFADEPFANLPRWDKKMAAAYEAYDAKRAAERG